MSLMNCLVLNVRTRNARSEMICDSRPVAISPCTVRPPLIFRSPIQAVTVENAQQQAVKMAVVPEGSVLQTAHSRRSPSTRRAYEKSNDHQHAGGSQETQTDSVYDNNAVSAIAAVNPNTTEVKNKQEKVRMWKELGESIKMLDYVSCGRDYSRNGKRSLL